MRETSAIRTETDAELLKRGSTGNRHAVGELYTRYGGVLIAVAVRVLRARADAEDVVQDLFVSLPDRAQLYVPERGSVATWLVILLRNASIDRVRRRASRARAHARADGPPHPADPEAVTSASFRRARLLRALGDLPDLQRDAVVAAFFDGLSHPELAARAGVPMGTIKSRCARAIAALRHALQAEDLSTTPRAASCSRAGWC
jgi:RNA polymerase sigma-70 factor (ECF subfamily)